MSALQSMQIPPQEDWSLELLHELQRAVPVLESSSFNLDDDIEVNDASGAGASASVGASDPQEDAHAGSGASDMQWRGWECGDEAGSEKNSADLLSDDAMALPMSTLTSGKRKTYPNRSTFQSHVCCVMHPSQVPHVLQTLQASPHFQSVSHWPYAYRIISPFDGQTHEGSDDGEDAGAGEKMLALLQRMGLENLLLIVSRWDTGPPDRLGLELFKCINQQCKELLRELQQAVRASFPPEELLRADFAQNAEAEKSGCEERVDADFAQAESSDAPIVDRDYEVLESKSAASPIHPEEETESCSPRLFDFRAVGSTPQMKLWHKVFYGYPVRVSRPVVEQSDEEPSARDPQRVQEALEVAASCGLQVKAAPMNHRATSQRRTRAGKGRGRGLASSQGAAATSPEEAPSAAAAASPALAATAMAEGRNSTGTAGSNRDAKAHHNYSSSCDDHDSASSGDLSGDEDSEELLRYGAELRMDRLALEEKLGELGHAAEVIRNLNAPFFEGIAEIEPAEKREPVSSASKYNKRASRMIKQDIMAFNKRQSAKPGQAGKGGRVGGSTLQTAGLSLLGLV
mmetsp:Transcript_2513/g.4036  ORF Transcript_2513/g.4036 Transcript_2513/m.4036 type:complete len:572 (+) Transcript_2513:75-1790(+)